MSSSNSTSSSFDHSSHGTKRRQREYITLEEGEIESPAYSESQTSKPLPLPLPLPVPSSSTRPDHSSPRRYSGSSQFAHSSKGDSWRTSKSRR
jgi:hypothetical protein